MTSYEIHTLGKHFFLSQHAFGWFAMNKLEIITTITPIIKRDPYPSVTTLHEKNNNEFKYAVRNISQYSERDKILKIVYQIDDSSKAEVHLKTSSYRYLPYEQRLKDLTVVDHVIEALEKSLKSGTIWKVEHNCW
jgi:hypothetical protein